jgi:hypothetical protein
MSEEQALILKDIGDYQPGHALKSSEMVSHEKGFESAGSVYFRTLYTKTGERFSRGRSRPGNISPLSFSNTPTARGPSTSRSIPRIYMSRLTIQSCTPS